MTEHAVRLKFREFIDEVGSYIVDEVDPTNVVETPPALPEYAFRKAAQPVVERRVGKVREHIERQFDLVADAAVEGEAEPYEEPYLRADIFYTNHVGDEESKRALEEDLRERFRGLVEAARPMAVSDEDGFWDAVLDGYDDADEAVRALRGNFEYAEIVNEYEDDVRLAVTLRLGPVERSVEYTEEALRVLNGGEKHLREKVESDTREVFSAEEAPPTQDD